MSVAKRGLALLECLALLALALAAGDRASAAAAMPRVELATREPIPDEPKVAGTLRLRHPSGGYNGPIGIETRGQTSQTRAGRHRRRFRSGRSQSSCASRTARNGMLA